MCWHKLYIFTLCGHSVVAASPTRYGLCQAESPERIKYESDYPSATVPTPRISLSNESTPSPTVDSLTQTENTSDKGQGKIDISDTEPRKIQENECAGPRTHPYHTVRIHRLCAMCTRRRDILLASAETTSSIRFDEWKWKVKYQSPRVEDAVRKDWEGVGEMMGSWVGGWGWERGIEMENRVQGGSWIQSRKETTLEKGEGKRKRKEVLGVGFRGGMPSS